MRVIWKTPRAHVRMLTCRYRNGSLSGDSAAAAAVLAMGTLAFTGVFTCERAFGVEDLFAADRVGLPVDDMLAPVPPDTQAT